MEFSFISEPEIDESVVEQLVSMGFAREGCRKAVYKTNNSGTEAAMNWVLEHMGDPGGCQFMRATCWLVSRNILSYIEPIRVGVIACLGVLNEPKNKCQNAHFTKEVISEGHSRKITVK